VADCAGADSLALCKATQGVGWTLKDCDSYARATRGGGAYWTELCASSPLRGGGCTSFNLAGGLYRGYEDAEAGATFFSFFEPTPFVFITFSNAPSRLIIRSPNILRTLSFASILSAFRYWGYISLILPSFLIGGLATLFCGTVLEVCCSRCRGFVEKRVSPMLEADPFP